MATKTRWDISNWQEGPVGFFNALGIKGTFQYGNLSTSLSNQVAQAVGQKNNPSGAGGSAGNISTGGAKGMRAVYNALRSAGASETQAIGLLANAMNESGLDPEAVGDGGTSFGLWQEHNKTAKGNLITGNASADIIRQVRFLVGQGGLRAASGATPEAAAGNFAANYERCSGCQPGGAQYNSRVANVAVVRKTLGL